MCQRITVPEIGEVRFAPGSGSAVLRIVMTLFAVAEVVGAPMLPTVTIAAWAAPPNSAKAIVATRASRTRCFTGNLLPDASRWGHPPVDSAWSQGPYVLPTGLDQALGLDAVEIREVFIKHDLTLAEIVKSTGLFAAPRRQPARL